MEGVEEFKADGATVRVMHDPQDNTAGLCVVRPRFGDVRIWLQPEQTAELIRALQRMHARQDRDEYAAANLAANKRIVELEQETDGLHDALRTCDESRKELIDGLKTARDTLDLGKRLIQALQHERDTARAELARLTTPRPIAEAPKDERSRILARGRDGQWREMRLVRGEWRWFGAGNEHIESPTEYLPLPVLP